MGVPFSVDRCDLLARVQMQRKLAGNFVEKPLPFSFNLETIRSPRQGKLKQPYGRVARVLAAGGR